MENKNVGAVILEGQDLVAYVNGVEVFRGRAGAIVERAYGIVKAVGYHEDPFKVESHVRNNRRYYFVKAGDVILKESVHAGKVHDFVDRLNGAKVEQPRQAEPQAEPQAVDSVESAPVEDPFADE